MNIVFPLVAIAGLLLGAAGQPNVQCNDPSYPYTWPESASCDEDLSSDLGQDIQNIFEKHRIEVPFFTDAGNERFVLCDTIMRIKHRSFCQSGRNACGPTSVAQVAAEFKPLEIAEVIAEVYFKGTIKSIGYTMSPYISQLIFSAPDSKVNMHMGALLIFATALRDHRNQELTKLNPLTVPRNGFNRIQASSDQGTSFFTTAYDVQAFYEMFGYGTNVYVGRNNECTECQGTLSALFASDQAATKLTIQKNLQNPSQEASVKYAQDNYPWSPRTLEIIESKEEQEIIQQYLSRLGKEGLEFACNNAGPVSVCINDAVLYEPVNDATCNEQLCLPNHWVVLESCDLAQNECKIVTYGGLRSLHCDLLANFTTAIVAAVEPEAPAKKSSKKSGKKGKSKSIRS